MTHNLKSIVSLLLEKEVNFEVFYSTDATKKGEDSLRVTLLVELDPTVRVDFGDKRHGQLIRRIHVTGNHLLTLKEQEFLELINEASSALKERWVTQASEAKHPTMAGVFGETPDPDVKRVTGTVTGNAEITDVSGTDVAKTVSFDVSVPVYVLNKVTQHIDTAEPFIVKVKAEVESKRMAEAFIDTLRSGDYVSFDGSYAYPNILVTNV